MCIYQAVDRLRSGRRGFSLIELMIVVAIIGIIATIAIPILLSARRNAMNEKARQSIRNVVSAEIAFYARNGHYDTLDTLATGDPQYLDQRFNSGTGQMGNGLTITMTLSGNGQNFSTITENPGGSHNYQSNEDGSINEL